jgi:hypothetical protein
MLVVMKLKNMDWSLIGTSQNEKKCIDSHSKFVLGTQYIM